MVVENNAWELAMESVLRLRALGSLCRQQAAHHPDQRWKLLAEAEYWEHKAQNARNLSDAVIARRYLDLQRLRDEVRKAERNCALKGPNLKGSNKAKNQLNHSERHRHYKGAHAL
jgi:hypothetical protein